MRVANFENDISTNRLTLSRVALQDCEFIYRLVNSKDWLMFIGDRKINDLESAKQYIEKIRNTKDFYYWVVRLKESQTPVGIVSFLKRDYLPHFDIGFALLPEYYRRGYAQEATEAIISEASNQHRVLLATVMPSNRRSIQLLEKLGFRFSQILQVNEESLNVYELIF